MCSERNRRPNWILEEHPRSGGTGDPDEDAEVRLLIAVLLDVVVDDPFDSERELCFMKHQGQWGLYMKSTKTTTSLLHSSRETRVEAARNLNGIVDQIIRAVEQETGQVQRGVDAVRQLLVDMGGDQS